MVQGRIKLLIIIIGITIVIAFFYIFLSHSSKDKHTLNVYCFYDINDLPLQRDFPARVRIMNNTIYINHNLYYKNDNYLLVRKLKKEEKEYFTNIITNSKEKYNKIIYDSSKYYAPGRCYFIDINDNNLIFKTLIYKSSASGEMQSVIDFFSRMIKSKYDTVYSEIKGVNFFNILNNDNEDISKLKIREKYFDLWLYTILYKGKIEDVNYQEYLNIEGEKHSISYGLCYEGIKLNEILINRNYIYLVYENKEVKRIINQLDK